MTTPVNTGSVATTLGASPLTVVSPSATAGNKLKCQVAWVDVGTGSAETLSVPSGWTADRNGASSFNGGSLAAAGYAQFSKTAAGGVENCVVASPGIAANFFASGLITEWPSTVGAHDTADASAVVSVNAGASTTGATIPNTGTLGQANNVVLGGIIIAAGAGLTNAGIAIASGFTTLAVDQNSSTDVSFLFAYKNVSSTAPTGAVASWASDGSMNCAQAALTIYADSAGAAAVDSAAKLGREPGLRLGTPISRLRTVNLFDGQATTLPPPIVNSDAGAKPGWAVALKLGTPLARLRSGYDQGISAVTPSINAGTGVYSWSGTGSAITELISASLGSYTWAGTTSVASGLIQAGIGTYAWSGTTSSASELIAAGVGSYSWTGTTAATTSLINAGIGAYAWNAPTATLGGPISAAIGAYSWSATTATLGGGISSSVGAYVWAGVAASIPALIPASTGSFTWAGTQASLNQNVSLAPGPYNWAGRTASFTQLISASTGGYTWAASTGTLGGGIRAIVGAYSWSGRTAGVGVPSGQIKSQFSAERDTIRYVAQIDRQKFSI